MLEFEINCKNHFTHADIEQIKIHRVYIDELIISNSYHFARMILITIIIDNSTEEISFAALTMPMIIYLDWILVDFI